MRHAQRARLLLLCFVLAACGNETRSAASSASERDSAGVRIVQYAALPAESPHWRVSDSVLVDIGAAEGEAAKLFGRVSGFDAPDDSTIVVGDGQAQELRSFGSRGDHRWTAGGKGSGPGEFTSLGGVFGFGHDSVAAVNHFSRALSVFDASGRFVRTFQLAPPNTAGFGSQSVRGVLADGTVVAAAAQDFGVGGSAPGYRRDPFLLVLYDGLGNVIREIGPFPDFEVMIEDMHGHPIVRPIEMGRSTIVSAGPGSIVVATTDRFEFRRYDQAGALRLIVRVAGKPVATDASVRAAFVQGQLASMEDEKARAQARPMIEKTVLPDTLPAVGDAVIDAGGNVWIREFVPPYDNRAPVWSVFDPNGKYLASASIPLQLQDIRIASGHVVGLLRDSLGVAHIQKRLILKPS